MPARSPWTWRLEFDCGVGATAFVEFVTTQKYVALAAVGWYLVFGVRMVSTTELRSVERNVPLDWEAEEHLRQIQRGG